MSTRSRIGMLHPDGTITTVYCHNDGYWSWNGRILWEHWRDGKGLRDMMRKGAMSVLGEVIGEKHKFDWQHSIGRDFGAEFEALSDAEKRLYLDTRGEPNRYVYERAELKKDPRSKMCVFFGRDRGEGKEFTEACKSSIEDAPWEEFAYLYDEANKRWLTSDTAYTPDRWHLLSDVMDFYEKMEPDEHGRKHLGHEGLPDGFPTVSLPEPVVSDEDQAALATQEAVAIF